MNLGAIRTQVRDIIGEESADFWSDAELNRYITEALYRFASAARWPFLITEGTDSLTGGDAELPLQDGVDAQSTMNITLTVVGETRSYQPKRVPPSKGFQLRSMYPSTTQRTFPEWFYVTRVDSSISGDEGIPTWVIRFIPTPVTDMDVEYQYFRNPAELTADNDIPELPVKYHKALVHYAAATAWLKELNGGAKAREQLDLYQGVLNDALKEWESEPDDDPLVVGKDEPQVEDGVGFFSDPTLMRIPETLGP